jgi:transcription initiation factor IIE alpha subunit
MMNKNNRKYITSDTTIEYVVSQYPELIRPLMEYGIKCVVCGEPLWGTLAENANSKGIKNLDAIIDKLNQLTDNNKS